MAGITAYQREIGWNVRILDGPTMSSFAGFYQQADFATVEDIMRDLDIYFELRDDIWRPALMPVDGGPIISLEKDNLAPFPTPPPEQQATYYFVYHDPSCDAATEHSLTSKRQSTGGATANIAGTNLLVICQQPSLSKSCLSASPVIHPTILPIHFFSKFQR